LKIHLMFNIKNKFADLILVFINYLMSKDYIETETFLIQFELGAELNHILGHDTLKFYKILIFSPKSCKTFKCILEKFNYIFD
jgi:hypothetical protein